jgi:hypothetical protein
MVDVPCGVRSFWRSTDHAILYQGVGAVHKFKWVMESSYVT